MTTTTTAPATQLSGVSFIGILNSEWIKLRSLRSTVWCYAIMVVVTIGFGLLFAASSSFTIAGTPDEVLTEQNQSMLLLASTVGISFSQLVAIILGALMITGEYGTGMIRSTFAAVPTRTPAVIGKATVFTLVTFVVSLFSIAVTALISQPILAANGFAADLADPKLWGAIAGGAAYIALIGLFGMAVGTIIRNSAGSIAAALAMVLVLPTILQLFTAFLQAQWASNISTFLPNNAGQRMFAYPTEAEAFQVPGLESITLEPWQGALVLIAWVVGLFLVAGVLLKRRDA